MMKALATRMVLTIGSRAPGWGPGLIALIALVVLVGGADGVPTGISWT
ncbi:hypothetical protein [Sphaerisporangium sp. TRM90804]|nr:hypothetical protein [Sphaerisporangium sp. TRM90804]MDH2427791.1 hypothetical protein [Sphaerisporangium sp. TRM90804]